MKLCLIFLEIITKRNTKIQMLRRQVWSFGRYKNVLWLQKKQYQRDQTFTRTYGSKPLSRAFIPVLSLRYRRSPQFVISQFMIPAISWFYFRCQFCEFPTISWFWKKNVKKIFFQNIFWKISDFIFFITYSNVSLKVFSA